jgi:hypothetical protein
MKKPIDPKTHAIIDYILVGSLFAVPLLLGFKKEAKLAYGAMGSALLTYVALSDHGLSVKPVIPFPTHCKVDVGNLIGTAAVGAMKSIRKDKRASLFHAAFVLLGAMNLVLTKKS